MATTIKNISRFQAYDILKENNSKIFSCEFIKKDKTIRKLVGRFGVKKHLKGGKKAYNPIEKNLLSVFDMQKKAYRSINLDTLKNLKVNKVTYLVR